MDKALEAVKRIKEHVGSNTATGRILGFSESTVSDILTGKRKCTCLEAQAWEYISYALKDGTWKRLIESQKYLDFNQIRELHLTLIEWNFGRDSDFVLERALNCTRAEIMKAKTGPIKASLLVRIFAGAAKLGMIETPSPDDENDDLPPFNPEQAQSEPDEFDQIDLAVQAMKNRVNLLEVSNRLLESENKILTQKLKDAQAQSKPEVLMPEHRQFLVDSVNRLSMVLGGGQKPINPLVFQALWADIFACVGVKSLNDILTIKQWEKASAYVFKRADKVGLKLTEWRDKQ